MLFKTVTRKVHSRSEDTMQTNPQSLTINLLQPPFRFSLVTTVEIDAGPQGFHNPKCHQSQIVKLSLVTNSQY